jgi:hypothetical protein
MYRAQALLASIDKWRLDGAKWSAVDHALESLDQALDCDDQAAAGGALANLALLNSRARPSRPLQPELGSSEGPSQRTQTLIDKLILRLIAPDDVPVTDDNSR